MGEWEPEVQGRLQLQMEFEVSLGYMAIGTPNFKKSRRKKEQLHIFFICVIKTENVKRRVRVLEAYFPLVTFMSF